MAGALERKVWCKTAIGNFYPHLYVILCGPPAAGKSIISSLVAELWGELKDHHLAPSGVSRASLMDALRHAERKIILPENDPPIVTFNSLKMAISELGVLMPLYDVDIMNHLQDIWDCKPYSEMKRTKELNYTIKAPQINLITGCTPSYLKSTMPEGAWDQGFISRSIIVYSSETILKDMFNMLPSDTAVYNALIEDLQTISDYYEYITFHPDVAKSFNAWRYAGELPKPDHPKLIHYNARRASQLLKLCMIACVDRGPCGEDSDFVVIPEDYQTAQSWLFDAEFYMGDIFKAMANGGDSGAMDQIWHYCYSLYMKDPEKSGVPESKIIHYANTLVPAYNVAKVIEMMVKAGVLTKKLDRYIPAARNDF